MRSSHCLSVLFKLIIHVGVSKGDNQISLEKQSFNLGYNHQDIQDKCPANECCVENGAEILQTKLDVDRLCKVSNSRLESCNSEGKSIPSNFYLTLKFNF